MKRFTFLSAFVICLVIFAQGQWIYNDLPEARFCLSSTSLGNKVYFAGGDNGSSSVYQVEVYDIVAEDWDTTIELSVGRAYPSCTSTGSKAFFAGGLDWYSFGFYSEVDIWDAISKTWIYEQLSVPRFSICAAAKGNTVLFAGGTNLALGETYDVVDIYNVASGTWTVAHLSEPRSAMAHVVIGDLAFFAGGFDVVTGYVSKRIDIYRFSTGTWSIDSLSLGRCFLAAAYSGSKVLFGGGTTEEDERTDRVDIYDTLTGEWTTTSLSMPRSFVYDNAATVCGKAYFVGGGDIILSGGPYWTTLYDVIDIYDATTHQWTIDYITQPAANFTVCGIDNYLVKAGGQDPSPFSLVEVYIDDPADCFVGTRPGPGQEARFSFYPNPSTGILHLESHTELHPREMFVCLYTLQGQLILEQTLSGDDDEINLPVPDGVYILSMRAGESSQQELVVVKK